MSREVLMKKMMALDFMAVDLGLFLDTHPHDNEAIKTYNCIVEEGQNIRKKYEEDFGPICMRSGARGNDWCWIDDPWPWQKEAGFNLRGE